MGTPEFAATVLTALIDAGHRSAPSTPSRRGRRGAGIGAARRRCRRWPSGTGSRCTPASCATRPSRRHSPRSRADAAVVAAYGLLLPSRCSHAPRLGCLNIHASLLPRWRGAAPIQRAILAGDAETGVTIMQMEEGLDTGPMLLQEAIPIGAQETAGAARERLAELGARLIVAGARRAGARHAAPRPQPSEGVDLRREDAPRGGVARLAPAGRPSWSGRCAPSIRGPAPIFAAAASASACWRPRSHPKSRASARHDRRRAADDRLRRGRAAAAAACSAPGARALDAADFLRGFALPPGTVLPCPATS